MSHSRMETKTRATIRVTKFTIAKIKATRAKPVAVACPGTVVPPAVKVITAMRVNKNERKYMTRKAI